MLHLVLTPCTVLYHSKKLVILVCLTTSTKLVLVLTPITSFVLLLQTHVPELLIISRKRPRRQRRLRELVAAAICQNKMQHAHRTFVSTVTPALPSACGGNLSALIDSAGSNDPEKVWADVTSVVLLALGTLARLRVST